MLRSFQRQPLNQAVLALLLGSAVYALFVLGSVSEEEDRPVPELSVTVAMGLAAVSLGLFVVFLHHAVRSLNASAVIRRIAAEGHESIGEPYPVGAGREPDDTHAAEETADALTGLHATEVRAPRAGYIASVDGARIVVGPARTTPSSSSAAASATSPSRRGSLRISRSRVYRPASMIRRRPRTPWTRSPTRSRASLAGSP